jgi:hypothetical protein
MASSSAMETPTPRKKKLAGRAPPDTARPCSSTCPVPPAGHRWALAPNNETNEASPRVAAPARLARAGAAPAGQHGEVTAGRSARRSLGHAASHRLLRTETQAWPDGWRDDRRQGDPGRPLAGPFRHAAPRRAVTCTASRPDRRRSSTTRSPAVVRSIA